MKTRKKITLRRSRVYFRKWNGKGQPKLPTALAHSMVGYWEKKYPANGKEGLKSSYRKTVFTFTVLKGITEKDILLPLLLCGLSLS